MSMPRTIVSSACPRNKHRRRSDGRRHITLSWITMSRTCFLAPVVLLLGLNAVAAEFKILPANPSLTGPGASQRLLVVAEEDGKTVGDRTAQATFASSDEKIVRVSPAG